MDMVPDSERSDKGGPMSIYPIAMGEVDGVRVLLFADLGRNHGRQLVRCGPVGVRITGRVRGSGLLPDKK